MATAKNKKETATEAVVEAPKTVSVRNKTNQKQLVQIEGKTFRFEPYGTLQIQGTAEDVERQLLVKVRMGILSITKNY